MLKTAPKPLPILRVTTLVHVKIGTLLSRNVLIINGKRAA